MKVTVIGTGNMGSAFVRQLTRAGHPVSVTARDLDKAAKVAAAHPGAVARPASEAVDGADVVILATGFADAPAAIRAVGGLAGKVVIDITNPLTSDYMGLTIGHDTSAGEEIARAAPKAEVAKAFNTVFAQVLADGPVFGAGRKVPTFVASDSERAKQTVRALAESIGFDVIDAGGLVNARYLEPLGGLNIYLGYGAGRGTDIAPTWISRS